MHFVMCRRQEFGSTLDEEGGFYLLFQVPLFEVPRFLKEIKRIFAERAPPIQTHVCRTSQILVATACQFECHYFLFFSQWTNEEGGRKTETQRERESADVVCERLHD